MKEVQAVRETVGQRRVWRPQTLASVTLSPRGLGLTPHALPEKGCPVSLPLPDLQGSLQPFPAHSSCGLSVRVGLCGLSPLSDTRRVDVLLPPDFHCLHAASLTTCSHRFCKNVFDHDYKATIGVDFEIERFEIAGIPYSLQM